MGPQGFCNDQATAARPTLGHRCKTAEKEDEREPRGLAVARMSVGVLVGAVLGSTAGLFLVLGIVIFLLLWLLPYDKALVAPVQYDPTPTPALDDALWDDPAYRRTTLFFRAKTGERLGAWLYEPKKLTGVAPPVVIMAHGIGLQKDMVRGPPLHPFPYTLPSPLFFPTSYGALPPCALHL